MQDQSQVSPVEEEQKGTEKVNDESSPAEGSVNPKMMSMEEKLALWRTQKRANKVQRNRKISYPQKAAWPPEKCDTFKPPPLPDHARQNSNLFAKSMKISFEKKQNANMQKSRRHSLGPAASRKGGKGQEKGRGFDRSQNISTTPPVTARKKTCTTYTQTSLLVDDKQVQTEDKGDDKTLATLEEEVDSLRFSNEVLLQQVREARHDADARKADEQVLTLTLQRKDDKLEEQEKRFAEELMQIQNILKAGLEKSVVEIDNLRAELDKYKELYYNLLESTQSGSDGVLSEDELETPIPLHDVQLENDSATLKPQDDAQGDKAPIDNDDSANASCSDALQQPGERGIEGVQTDDDSSTHELNAEVDKPRIDAEGCDGVRCSDESQQPNESEEIDVLNEMADPTEALAEDGTTHNNEENTDVINVMQAAASGVPDLLKANPNALENSPTHVVI